MMACLNACVLLLFLVGFQLAQGAPKKGTLPGTVCGAEPKPLQGFSVDSAACWFDAAWPAEALNFTPMKVQAMQRIAARSWDELQQIVSDADGPVHVSVLGSLQATAPLLISSKAAGVRVSGPARITCSAADEASTAIIIKRSTNVILQDLTITGCSSSAVVINATAARPAPITTAAAATAAAAGAAPDVLLTRVTITDCATPGKGAGVAMHGSRVVLQECELTGNAAAGCGGGVYAQGSALLVLDSTFAGNLGNNTAGDDVCRGGALHAQRSWLGLRGSTFSGNRGVNGSAVLLVGPVGVGQLQDCTFDNNSQRAGVSHEFSSSSGAVSVVGSGAYPTALERGPDGGECEPVTEGMVVARCSFSNNTAALTGGEGGALSGYESFLAVINTTIVGTPPVNHSQTWSKPVDPSLTALDSVVRSTGREEYRHIVLGAYTGGCLAMEGSSLLVAGSTFSHCNARFVGGAISTLAATIVAMDSHLNQNYADMGGGIRATNGKLLLANVTVERCRGLSTAAGIYLESNEAMDVHMEAINVQHNALTGRGGGLLAEMVEEEAELLLSIHNSNIQHNTGTYGGGLCIYSATHADLRNNVIAHNTALKFGGGMECATFYGAEHAFTSVNNTWLNNTALIRGGGAITHPCVMTVHGDRFLGNRAEQEGGGFMVYGGKNVVLQNVTVSCNTAQNGGGVMVKLSDSSDESKLNLRCSNVTANGGLADAAAQTSCLRVLAAAATGTKGRAAAGKSQVDVLLAAVAAAAGGDGSSAAAAAGSSAVAAAAAAAAGAEKGGGLYVAADQEAIVINSIISGNRASSSGGGVYLDRKAVMSVTGTTTAGLRGGGGLRGGLGAAISYNNCTGGSGGGLFMEEGAQLTANGTSWNNNQGMFGGAVFAMGNETSLALSGVVMANNTAAAGGAVATLGGSRLACSGDCSFNFNRAKVGGALMLHGGAVTIKGSSMTANTAAAAAAGAAATAAAAAAGTSTAAETIQYMLGEVQVSAGGAAYVWRGQLELVKCNIVSNIAWGPTGRGGGIFVDDSQLSLVNSTFTNNWASAAGGGVLLGPTGSKQLVKVKGGSFSGNAAGQFGGAVASGLLLPGDAAAATVRARAGGAAGGSSQWTLGFSNTLFVNNTAGRQGGAVACSLCDSLTFDSSTFRSNGAVQTGGGVSCVGCRKFETDSCSFGFNSAASGGGACILAAGEGSKSSSSSFVGNAAGAAAAAAARQRLQAAGRTAAALAVPSSSSSGGAAFVAAGAAAAAADDDGGSGLPTAQQALPACGVVGSGGGLCLGLWGTSFSLQGSATFLNNSALFGAGLFVEACPEGPVVCPLKLNPKTTKFSHNTLSAESGFAAAYSAGLARRHLLQGPGPVAADMAAMQHTDGSSGSSGSDSLGSGADLYVTNATVLVQAERPAAAAAAVAEEVAEDTATAATVGKQPAPMAVSKKPAAAAAAAGGRADAAENKQVPGSSSETDKPSDATGGRHLLEQQQQQQQQQQPQQGGQGAAVPAAQSAASLAVAEELARNVQQPSGSSSSSSNGSSSSSSSAAAGNTRVATGPAQLGQVVVTGRDGTAGGTGSSSGAALASSNTTAAAAAAGTAGDKKHSTARSSSSNSSSSNSSSKDAAARSHQLGPGEVVEGTVGDNGRLQGVELPVLDQLGGQVANDVAEQLSVQATADFGNCTACQLSGISKVLPVNGTARFDQLQVLAKPGTNQTITFKLLSAMEGVELPGSRQTVRVQLPSCHWGQATTAVGCYNCTSPLFSFSPSTSKCSICPDNVAYCSGTSLLPDSGYWHSGPLSTRMHKCPRRNACHRSEEAMQALQCLQQQELIINNPDYAADASSIGDTIRSSSSSAARMSSTWGSLRTRCAPILLKLADQAATESANGITRGSRGRSLLQQAGPAEPATSGSSSQPTSYPRSSMMLNPFINSSEAVQEQYEALMCATGYTGRLCTNCIFPGNGPDGAYGQFYTGCAKCPPWSTSVATYVLSRVFDLLLVGLLILTTLVEMKKRRQDVQSARRAAFAKLGSGQPAAGATGSSCIASVLPSQQLQLQQLSQQVNGLSLKPAALPGTPSNSLQQQQGGPAAAAGGGGLSNAAAAAGNGLDTDPAAMWMSGAAVLGDDAEDAPLPPVGSTDQQQLQQRGSAAAAAAAAAGGAVEETSGLQQQQQMSQPQSVTSQQPQRSGSLTKQQLQALEAMGSYKSDTHQQQQRGSAAAAPAAGGVGAGSISSVGSGLLVVGQSSSQYHNQHGPGPVSVFAAAGALPSIAASGSGGVTAAGSGAAAAAGATGAAAAPGQQPAAAAASRRRSRRPLKRGPLFAREFAPQKGGSGSSSARQVVINYSPARLTIGELFEVFKDFLQVLSILQAVLLGWQSAAAAALSSLSVTPLSTKAWISLDCILPRTQYVARHLEFYQIAASILLPVSYAVLLLLIWLAYAVSLSLRTGQHLFRDVLGLRLKAPIISTLLVMLSYFYPALAYTILGVFSCRYLDPSSGGSSIPGEVLTARGWFWTNDLNRQCFLDPEHRRLALGLGIPGTLLLLAYPLLQGIILSRKAAAGLLQPTSEFFASYGHLVEDFRPRLFYWGSIVELRKLVLVAVVLGLASTGVISQLVGCCLVLLGFCAATMGLLPYPYRVLNRLHLGSAGVLLAVVWLNLFVAVGEEGGVLSGGISGKHSLTLQLLSVALVVGMIAVLLGMCSVRAYRKVRDILDVDKDGRISWADIQAVMLRLQAKRGPARVLAQLFNCCKPRGVSGASGGAAAVAGAGPRGGGLVATAGAPTP